MENNPVSPTNWIREQLPERLRDTYAIMLQGDAFGLITKVRFKHMKTEQEHVVILSPTLKIPDADLAYLCVVD